MLQEPQGVLLGCASIELSSGSGKSLIQLGREKGLLAEGGLPKRTARESLSGLSHEFLVKAAGRLPKKTFC